MNQPEKFTLCDEKNPNVWVAVEAEIKDGCLKISGQDLGQLPTELFGGSDCEYFYDFDRENTERLLSLLAERDNAGRGAGALLLENFSGMEGCGRLREFCAANRIKYQFSTWT